MSLLCALPKELLLDILSYLPPRSIEALAQTCSYDITPTCLPFLTSLVARRRHIKAMTAHFGPFSFSLNPDFAKVLETATQLNFTSEEKRCMRNPKETEIPYRMEHLDWVFETDELAWLARMPRHDLHPVIRAFTRTRMAQMEASIGFALPAAYTTLFTSQDLLDRLPIMVANCLKLPKGVRHIESEGTQGCLMNIYNGDRFTVSPTYKTRWAMYISPHGPSCVLRTHVHRNGPAEHDVRFQGVGFGEWLAMMCYGMDKYNGQVIVGLEDYWKAMYVTGNCARDEEGVSI